MSLPLNLEFLLFVRLVLVGKGFPKFFLNMCRYTFCMQLVFQYRYGGKVTSSISKKTSYLVVGEEPGESKLAKVCDVTLDCTLHYVHAYFSSGSSAWH